MSNSHRPADWYSDYTKRRERECQEARNAVMIACDQLRDLGASQVRIEYDGYGDSGIVENVSATNQAGEVEIPDELREALISAAECLLPDGWENNEGAFGQFVLDVSARQLTREHRWRIESTEYDEEAWEL